jgi:hypothetical protein
MSNQIHIQWGQGAELLKFLSQIFTKQIFNFKYLPPENFTFNFNQGQTLVLPSKGLSEFSQSSLI